MNTSYKSMQCDTVTGNTEMGYEYSNSIKQMKLCNHTAMEFNKKWQVIAFVKVTYFV